MEGKLYQVLRERNELFMRSVTGVFRQLIAWYPSQWEGFLELHSTIQQESEIMWGQVGGRPRSETERRNEANQLNQDIQGLLDRWASLTRGFARLIGNTEPLLAERAWGLSQDIESMLEDYKATLGTPITEEQRKVESALAE